MARFRNTAGYPLDVYDLGRQVAQDEEFSLDAESVPGCTRLDEPASAPASHGDEGGSDGGVLSVQREPAPVTSSGSLTLPTPGTDGGAAAVPPVPAAPAAPPVPSAPPAQPASQEA